MLIAPALIPAQPCLAAQLDDMDRNRHRYRRRRVAPCPTDRAFTAPAPRRAGPRRAAPCRAEPCRAESSRAEPSRVDSTYPVDTVRCRPGSLRPARPDRPRPDPDLTRRDGLVLLYPTLVRLDPAQPDLTHRTGPTTDQTRPGRPGSVMGRCGCIVPLPEAYSCLYASSRPETPRRLNPRLPRDCPKLPEAKLTRDCPKLPETARNCPEGAPRLSETDRG